MNAPVPGFPRIELFCCAIIVGFSFELSSHGFRSVSAQLQQLGLGAASETRWEFKSWVVTPQRTQLPRMGDEDLHGDEARGRDSWPELAGVEQPKHLPK